MIDREKARVVFHESGVAANVTPDELLDALDTCIVSAAPVINREAFIAVWDAIADEDGAVDQDELLWEIRRIVGAAQ